MNPSHATPHISIDSLIEVVRKGGKIRTGIDIFSKNGTLLLEKDALVEKDSVLQRVKKMGVTRVPILAENAGGVWDANGKRVKIAPPPAEAKRPAGRPVAETPQVFSSDVTKKVQEMHELRREAAEKYREAKKSIKKIILQIIENGGEFDVESVEKTVNEPFAFISRHSSAFSYLTREIFDFDDYLYNHSINVCTIGTAIIKNFNDYFSSTVSRQLSVIRSEGDAAALHNDNSFTYYYPEELRDIAMGFFVHDIGKVLIDRSILLKKDTLTNSEFEEVKLHSTEKGLELLEKNKLRNPFLSNISRYHHAALYSHEPRCYPEDRGPLHIPPYVKICKLADIYDAVTSRRCYKEAHNPVTAVADIFHKYAEKDHMLQIILHSFVKAIGIYPPSSIVWLTNGQLAYVLDSHGPTLVPITDASGDPLPDRAEPITLAEAGESESGLLIDRSKIPLSPIEAYKLLPSYLRESYHQAPASEN